MPQSSSTSPSLDFRALVDTLGQGVLLFDAHDRLVYDNAAARAILGANLVLVRAEGWRAAAMLLDTARGDGLSADETRAKALRQMQPVRFHTFLSGAYTPGWAAGVHMSDGTVYTMLTLEHPDWSALTELMSRFRSEARMSITSTRGHAELIKQVIAKRKENTTAADLARQVSGFAALMATHMFRLEILVDQLQRLEDIRTGQLAQIIRHNRRAIELAGFLEDLLEDIAHAPLVENPDLGVDYRDQIRLDIPSGVTVSASRQHLTYIFRDLLRNSIMYSEPGAPVTIRATQAARARTVQIDVIDQGYGIREREAGRVFAPFQRARQPQIIAEFGYGLSLYLVKMEIEAMGGGIWFTSEEGAGATFSFKLPLHQPGGDA